LTEIDKIDVSLNIQDGPNRTEELWRSEKI